VNLSRELVKDIEDIEGDREEQAVTFPIRYGVVPALVLATASLLVLMGTTVTAIIFSLYNAAFMYLVLLADGVMCVSIILMWRNHSSTGIRLVSTTLKISMVIGLLSIIAGTI
jgi:geranylgeranylglycerol-phosphate geranylgeranyltransferase